MLESVIYLYSSIDKQLVQSNHKRESHVGMGAAFIVRNCARYKKCKSHSNRASAQGIDRGSILKERIERERDFKCVIEWVYAYMSTWG